MYDYTDFDYDFSLCWFSNLSLIRIFDKIRGGIQKPNVTAQFKYELKWQYFLLLKTQTESPSKWSFTVFKTGLCLNCPGLKAGTIHFLLPKIHLCKVGKWKENSKSPSNHPPAHSKVSSVGLLISFCLNIYLVPAAKHTAGDSETSSCLFTSLNLCLCIIKMSIYNIKNFQTSCSLYSVYIKAPNIISDQISFC